MQNHIPQAVQQIIEVFATDLAAVKFGDLEPGVLTHAADEVTAAADAVREAEAALAQAQTAFAEKQEALVSRAQRALAYARVYAEDNAALQARLESISLPKAAKRAPKAERVAKTERAAKNNSAENLETSTADASAEMETSISERTVEPDAETSSAEPAGRKNKRKKGASQTDTANAAE